MKYDLKKMSTEQAKQTIADLVKGLEGIDPSDLTEFEQKLLQKCTTNPPKFQRVSSVQIEHHEP